MWNFEFQEEGERTIGRTGIDEEKKIFEEMNCEQPFTLTQVCVGKLV